ncbi:MAG TPA: hypothetical protein VFC19_48755 [Candidatus Limnocylindrales bacterium]|nr:hypothetical protein [Candidatus Limnocylindrales bacterium]
MSSNRSYHRQRRLAEQAKPSSPTQHGESSGDEQFVDDLDQGQGGIDRGVADRGQLLLVGGGLFPKVLGWGAGAAEIIGALRVDGNWS